MADDRNNNQHCQNHETHTILLNAIRTDLDKMENKEELNQGAHSDLRERCSRMEQSVMALAESVGHIREQTNAIVKLSYNIETMTAQIKDVISLYKDHDDRINTLERVPGDRLVNFSNVFVIAAIVAVAGVIVGKFFM